jgi:hypothetical protein
MNQPSDIVRQPARPDLWKGRSDRLDDLYECFGIELGLANYPDYPLV